MRRLGVCSRLSECSCLYIKKNINKKESQLQPQLLHPLWGKCVILLQSCIWFRMISLFVGKGQFKEAPGVILTSPPIKDSEEVWNKYNIGQIWPVLSQFFPFSLLKSQIRKFPKNISSHGRIPGLCTPRNTVNKLFQHVSGVPKPQCPLQEAWTQHRWMETASVLGMRPEYFHAGCNRGSISTSNTNSLQFNQLATKLSEHPSTSNILVSLFILVLQWIHLWLVLNLVN